MIQTVFIPMTFKMSQEQAFFMQAQGKVEQARAKWVEQREEQEEELNRLIEEGWKLFHSGQIEDSHGVSFVYVLYRPHAAVDADIKQWFNKADFQPAETFAADLSLVQPKEN